MKNIRKIFLMMICFIVSLGFLGCGNKDTSSEKKILDFIVSDDTLEGGGLTKMAEKYNSIQDEVEIKILEIPYKDAKTKVRTMISAKQPPALMRVTGIDDFYGTMLDLSDVISFDEYNQALKNRVVVEDELVAVPINMTINGLIYNKTLFDQAGVKVPTSPEDIWTWDEFKNKLEKVVDNSDARFALAFDYSEHRWKTMMYQFGGGLFDKNGGPNLVTSENKEALKYFNELHTKGIIPEDMWLGGEDSGNLFKTGSIAALFSGSWRVLDFENSIESFEWGVTYMPKQKMRSTVTGGNLITSFKGSGFEDEAKEFIVWMMKDENYAEYCSYGSYIPTKPSVTPKYLTRSNELDILKKEGLAISPRLINDEQQMSKYKSLSNILRKEIVYILQGEKEIEPALESVQKKYLNNKIR